MPDETLDSAVARLEERSESVQRQMADLTGDIRELTSAVSELVRENRRFGEVEEGLRNLTKSVDLLWDRMRDAERAEAKRMRGIAGEAVKIVLGLIIGAIGMKYGLGG